MPAVPAEPVAQEDVPEEPTVILLSTVEPAHLAAFTRFGTLWSEMIREGVGHLDRIPADRRMSLKYEELLESREPELKRLAEFIGVDPDPEWLRAGAELLDDSRPGAAARLTPEELTALRESCEPGAAALQASV